MRLTLSVLLSYLTRYQSPWILMVAMFDTYYLQHQGWWSESKSCKVLLIWRFLSKVIKYQIPKKSSTLAILHSFSHASSIPELPDFIINTKMNLSLFGMFSSSKFSSGMCWMINLLAISSSCNAWSLLTVGKLKRNSSRVSPDSRYSKKNLTGTRFLRIQAFLPKFLHHTDQLDCFCFHNTKLQKIISLYSI